MIGTANCTIKHRVRDVGVDPRVNRGRGQIAKSDKETQLKCAGQRVDAEASHEHGGDKRGYHTPDSRPEEHQGGGFCIWVVPTAEGRRIGPTKQHSEPKTSYHEGSHGGYDDADPANVREVEISHCFEAITYKAKLCFKRSSLIRCAITTHDPAQYRMVITDVSHVGIKDAPLD